MFNRQFHPMEIRTMKLELTEQLQYLTFYVNWSLKESFVKAIGTGLGYDLLQVIIPSFIQIYLTRVLLG